MPGPYQPIENYGVIGDLNTVALISVEGSIDFLCLPDFDSPSIFASLLDHQKGGYFSIKPVLTDYRLKQMYLPDTNILVTRFLSADAVVEITDFMPVSSDEADVDEDHRRVIRAVRMIKGNAKMRLKCRPRFHYGRATHKVKHQEQHVAFLSEDGSDPHIHLVASVPLQMEEQDAVAEFSLNAGEIASFILICGPWDDKDAKTECEAVTQEFDKSMSHWRSWVGQSTYTGRWREIVQRSALVLKLLTSRKHGSIIAAPTFGLPERVGGERNWDYRYTWLRDASFTLYAFMRLGYTSEARHFMFWLKDRIARDAKRGPLQIMYRANGEKDMDESALEHFEGYRQSQPVRIGNEASTQFQLDIYGELLDAAYLANKYGDSIPYEGWKNMCYVIDWLGKNWKRPDRGIWEVRGGDKEFLHSRVMCWVAVDRAVRLSQKRSLPAPLPRWNELRSAIHEDVFTRFWNPKMQSFVAHVGADYVDASTLLMPLVRFISPTDPQWLSTLKRIEEDLTEDALVYRYKIGDKSNDGLTGTEGTFTACSFWYVECLARAHQLDKARLMFEKIISYSNHLGLYSEEIGPSGEHLGNFPQAFTHLALISAASYLDRALSTKGPREWA